MPLILSGNVATALGGAYEVANSCRFNPGDTAYMHKTPGSASNRKTFTVSAWVKRCGLRTDDTSTIFAAGDGSTDDGYFVINFNHSPANTIVVQWRGGEANNYKKTTRVFRDTSSWYHVVCAVDTTQAVEANRLKFYINGTQVTSFGENDTLTEDFEFSVNSTEKQMVGVSVTSAGNFQSYLDAYLSEVCLIDGSQLTPSSFGEFNSDSPTIWQPIDVSGLTFGTNGFYLDFEASGNLGNDVNGGTDLTEVNLDATDQATDTPTLNYCVQNIVATSIANAPAFSQGNLTLTASGNWKSTIGTFALTSGKWYFETWGGGGTAGTLLSGIASTAVIEAGGASNGVNNNFTNGVSLPGYAYHGSSGGMYRSDTSGNGLDQGGGSWGAAYDSDDIISVYIDLDNHKLYTAKNDTINVSGTGVSIATGYSYYPGAIPYSVTQSVNYGIGSFNGTAVSSAVADANGYGAFEYDPSRGGASDFDGEAKDFLAINSKNLAEYG